MLLNVTKCYKIGYENGTSQNLLRQGRSVSGIVGGGKKDGRRRVEACSLSSVILLRQGRRRRAQGWRIMSFSVS